MCGINGFNFQNEGKIKEMVQATKHRGPDGSGFFVDTRVSLGHNLLAITDTPDLGKQPFYSSDKNYTLIYNGEIYNYKELKEDLIGRGHNFATQGDTEVLLNGLIEYGAQFIKKLNGMFAFAFYDQRAGKLILARDRMGQKPLYYFWDNQKFIFSSELRGITQHSIGRQLDHDALNIFWQLGYIPGHKTLLQNISKICPGQYLEFDLNNNHLSRRWFSFSSAELPAEHFSMDKFRSLMKEVVLDHTMGLRPFGLYLSGGLDSSVVLYELLNNHINQLATYTTRFADADDKFNEDADIALRLSKELGTNHNELLVTEDEFIQALPKTIETLEEPRYHPSIPAYYLMAQQVSKDIVVVLTGDGGDELFMGYPKYYESRKMSSRYQRYPAVLLNAYYTLRAIYKNQISRGGYLRLNDVIDRWWYFSRIATKKEYATFSRELSLDRFRKYIQSIGAPSITNSIKDPENNLAELDRLFWLAEDSFIVSDKLEMNFGLEGRFPFADRRVVEYASAISSREKMDAPGTKGLIRRAYKDRLPDFVLNKRKSGWTAPATQWMGRGLGKLANDILSDDFYTETKSLFNFDSMKKNYLSGNKFNSLSLKHIFPVFTFQIWAKQFNVKL